jgi:hypothetical protein
MDTPAPHSTVSDTTGRPAGLVLGAGAVLMVVFMAMHPAPHAGAGHDAPSLLEHLRSDRNSVVHAVLVALMVPVLVGFTALAARLGLRRVGVLAGLVVYALGTLAGAVAALVNGFVVPRIAGLFADQPGLSADAAVQHASPVLALCHTVNTLCAQVDVIGASLAGVLWGLALAQRPGWNRAVGAIGIVCGALPLAALTAGRLPMDVHGFGGFVMLQSLWALAAASALVRARV